jgi:hypothetical protein
MQSIGVLDITFKAGADLSAQRYRAVVAGAGANEVSVAGANARAIGFLQNEPLQNQAAAVRPLGTTIAVAGAAIAKDAAVKTDANGALVAVGGEAAGTIVYVVGRALQAAGAAGDLIEVLIEKYRYTA